MLWPRYLTGTVLYKVCLFVFFTSVASLYASHTNWFQGSLLLTIKITKLFLTLFRYKERVAHQCWNHRPLATCMPLWFLVCFMQLLIKRFLNVINGLIPHILLGFVFSCELHQSDVATLSLAQQVEFLSDTFAWFSPEMFE